MKQIIENVNQIPIVFRSYLNDYLTVIKEMFKGHLLAVIVFGSVARDQWTKESDIDLLLLFSNKIIDKAELNQTLTQITIEFEQKKELKDNEGNVLYCPIKEIALVLKDLEHFRTLFYDISVDGIVIFDRNRVGFNFQEKIKRRIRENGIERIYISDTDFYWKRKDIKFGELIEL